MASPDGASRALDPPLSSARASARHESPAVRVTLVALLLAAWLYGLLRAARLSLTHDEALTWLIHVSGTWEEILFHTRPINSNNHLLHTALIKVAAGLLGDSELVLRIPALLGHALYLVAVQRILGLFLAGRRRVVGTLLLVSNPILIDFFSCARGYGFALGFATLGLYVVLERFASLEGARAARRNGAAVALLVAAVLTNLSFVNLFLAALAALLALELALRVRSPGASAASVAGGVARAFLLPAALGCSVLAAVYTPAVLARIRPNIAAWGGVRGVWVDTVGTVVECVLYGKGYAGAATVPAAQASVLVALLAAAAAALQARLQRGADRIVRMMAALALLLGGVTLSVKLQFVLSGTRYPVERGALYLVPLFLILLALSWEALHAAPRGRTRSAAAGALGLYVGALILHGALCLNASYYHLWRYDAATKAALREVRERTDEERLPRAYTLGTNWALMPAAEYYRSRDHLYWFEPVPRGGPDGRFDFYYIREEDLPVVAKYDLELLTTFPVSGAMLAAPRR